MMLLIYNLNADSLFQAPIPVLDSYIMIVSYSKKAMNNQSRLRSA